MTNITDEKKKAVETMLDAMAFEMSGDALNALSDIAGQIPDEDLAQRLAAYVVIAALANDKAARTVEVSATVMISLLAEIRRWRERYRVAEQPVQ
jgi:hypothetical protein